MVEQKMDHFMHETSESRSALITYEVTYPCVKIVVVQYSLDYY